MQPSICPSSMDYRYLASIFIWHPMGIYWVSQEKRRANPELKAQTELGPSSTLPCRGPYSSKADGIELYLYI
jgi:hypothetical protein